MSRVINLPARVKQWALFWISLGVLAGCNRMIIPRQVQQNRDADAKAAEGSYAEAINLYEAALDGSAGSADVHYKLALIYDDKMNDPLNALHHFKRFLALEPSGKRAQEVKSFMKRDQLNLLTNLTGDSMVPRAEAMRLRNENLNLRKQVEERWAENKAAASAEKVSARSRPKPREKIKRTGKERTYTVQRGDTLASISRKFYKRSERWQRILDANSDQLSKPGDLRPGQTLVIP
ncbi:MAG: LysM peptidoglycan-binding domain-containing protein [Verrucomicrobiota bacterium]|nr:LysM peptidoglycan-binding domain-containing protein [Verrucomicrobiota bacterium]